VHPLISFIDHLSLRRYVKEKRRGWWDMRRVWTLVRSTRRYQFEVGVRTDMDPALGLVHGALVGVLMWLLLMTVAIMT
jgi:hypothetical protein